MGKVQVAQLNMSIPLEDGYFIPETSVATGGALCLLLPNVWPGRGRKAADLVSVGDRS